MRDNIIKQYEKVPSGQLDDSKQKSPSSYFDILRKHLRTDINAARSRN